MRLRGDAVYSLTMMFLSLWDYCEGAVEDYDAYRPQVHAPRPRRGRLLGAALWRLAV